MRLILKQYLSSLKERRELDALLPDLLSQMGLEVFSRPDVGSRQYGVDIGAFGSFEGGSDTVYLLSVKSGDLGRIDWDGNSVQSLRPSLDEILDVYIPTHLPPAFRGYPVVICLCFGGEVKETVRLNVSSYESKHKTNLITFNEWNGDVIAQHIENHLLREELMPENCRPLLRKSLALLDEPEASHKYFSKLVRRLASTKVNKPVDSVTIIRQLNICLWILYAWCREEDNVEAAYRSSELVTLLTWEICKPYLGGHKNTDIAIIESLHSVVNLHIQIIDDYLENKIFPFANKLHAISSGVSPSCPVDVNLKLFDILGRVAMSGMWTLCALRELPDLDSAESQRTSIMEKVDKHYQMLVNIIINNPILFSPYKDDQAIDIALAALFMGLTHQSDDNLHNWLLITMQLTLQRFAINGPYPCTLRAYHELIEHPKIDDDSYREKVTAGSILYPIVASLAAIYEFDDVYDLVANVSDEFLEHCNFQLWYPDATSESYIYSNQMAHGVTLSHIDIARDKSIFLKSIIDECNATTHFEELSGVIYHSKPFPLVLLACRHYRVPVPIHILRELIKRQEVINK